MTLSRTYTYVHTFVYKFISVIDICIENVIIKKKKSTQNKLSCFLLSYDEK